MRAALTGLDPTRHSIIYLSNPTVGVRGIHHQIVDCHSPFACLLVGQPTLRRRMKLGALAALDQRIGLRYAMPPMTSEETSSYLRHPLALAGRSGTLFSDDAVALIHQTSRGCPGSASRSSNHRHRVIAVDRSRKSVKVSRQSMCSGNGHRVTTPWPCGRRRVRR